MKSLPLLAIASATLLATPVLGQDPEQARPSEQIQSQTQSETRARERIRDRDIYGSQMMTRQERNEYRNRMLNARTLEERERVRAEHHERMKERAQARGITLPDEPPAGRGPGSAVGGGRGPGGMGQGGGMGPGGGAGGGYGGGR